MNSLERILMKLASVSVIQYDKYDGSWGKINKLNKGDIFKYKL